jgi:predicted dienelactone hydrolase
MWRQTFAILGLGAALALAACRASAPAAARPSVTPSQAAPTASPLEISFVDALGRTVTAKIYLPADSGAKAPVVLFSHGLNALPSDYQALFQRWTIAGFAVVAPAYALTHRGASPLKADDLTNQPADAISTLDRALASADLANRLDGSNVVAAGHSEGALTTAGLFTACCCDPRLAGGIILAGNDLGFQRDGFSGSPAPLLFVHGDADPLIPIALGGATYARVPWPKGFITLAGAAHIPPYLGGDSPAADVVNATCSDFLRWVLRSGQTALDALRRDAAVAGVAKLDDQLSH